MSDDIVATLVETAIKVLVQSGNGTALDDAWSYQDEEFKAEWRKELYDALGDVLRKEGLIDD